MRRRKGGAAKRASLTQVSVLHQLASEPLSQMLRSSLPDPVLSGGGGHLPSTSDRRNTFGSSCQGEWREDLQSFQGENAKPELNAAGGLEMQVGES